MAWLGIQLLIVIFMGASYPEEVKNTFKAIRWCEKNDIVNVCSELTCVFCVEKYLEYHNLTKEEFPTYCWRSDEAPPSRLELLMKEILLPTPVYTGLCIFFLMVILVLLIAYLEVRKNAPEM